ncbi:MAG TPA: ABC transporter permease [Firmicutes bacterium]|nr:ABC transporter permease [Bacillota bacterium]
MKNQVLRRFMKRPASVLGAIVLIIFFLTAIFGPILLQSDPNAINPDICYQAPSLEHPFGTDNLGRDTFTRIVYGARVSLTVSFSGVLIGGCIGVMLGAIAGYFGSWIDALISRLIDILLAFPGLLLAIMVVAVLGSGLGNTIAAIAFYSIPYSARLIRGVVITIKNSEYCQACRVFGASDARIIMTHILPNSVSQIIVNTTLDLGTAILTASSLSFLGLGVQPPNPEWGAMLSTARDVIRSAPFAALIPGGIITLVVLSFSLVGDGLRDALDPKLRNS